MADFIPSLFIRAFLKKAEAEKKLYTNFSKIFLGIQGDL